ncbi:hypothetical protein [Desulfosporosinus sp. BICA1-9]|uniref:hypothetical protein n=1 Tax=Desulfosporosinus sp. BICA1-9 TaxID=1531958 RepID=UPI0025C6C4EF|nr:hypothetical protein [Desulfosporosinus sp. BICA1-9]
MRSGRAKTRNGGPYSSCGITALLAQLAPRGSRGDPLSGSRPGPETHPREDCAAGL